MAKAKQAAASRKSKGATLQVPMDRTKIMRLRGAAFSRGMMLKDLINELTDKFLAEDAKSK